MYDKQNIPIRSNLDSYISNNKDDEFNASLSSILYNLGLPDVYAIPIFSLKSTPKYFPLFKPGKRYWFCTNPKRYYGACMDFKIEPKRMYIVHLPYLV